MRKFEFELSPKMWLFMYVVGIVLVAILDAVA